MDEYWYLFTLLHYRPEASCPRYVGQRIILKLDLCPASGLGCADLNPFRYLKAHGYIRDRSWTRGMVP